MNIIPPVKKLSVDQTKVFQAPKAIRLSKYLYPDIKYDFENLCKIKIDPSANYSIEIRIVENINKNFYLLKIEQDQTTIYSNDHAHAAYAILTFIQIISNWTDKWYQTTVEDSPSYSTRAFMIDMGRSIFPLEFIKRIIRIMFRLKMNVLHMHLFDDELCSIRFEEFPFGKENPYSITIQELKEIINYAQKYYITIIPEIETWAHVGSIGYYFPDLIGGDGLYNGSTFIICNKTFELVKNITEQLVEVLPNNAILHFGLDEAIWYPGNDLPENFSPMDMVRTYYDILQKLNIKYNKKIKFALWADHNEDKKLPKNLIHQPDFIIEPWQYWIANKSDIDFKLNYYHKLGAQQILAGAGQSMAQFRGSYFATRYWAQKGMYFKNLIGIDTTLWGWNDVDNKFVTLFAGGYFSWHPNPGNDLEKTIDPENFDRVVFSLISDFTRLFKNDIDFDKMKEERIETVFNGYYLSGDKKYQPVAPTVPLARTASGHNFITEISTSTINQERTSKKLLYTKL